MNLEPVSVKAKILEEPPWKPAQVGGDTPELIKGHVCLTSASRPEKSTGLKAELLQGPLGGS